MGQLCSGGDSSSLEDRQSSAQNRAQLQTRTSAATSSRDRDSSRNNNEPTMGNSAIKQHYETAKKTGCLKLSRAKLNEFPPSLQQLEPILRTLDLSENRFVEMPREIGSFLLLKHLNFNNNKLTYLPEEVGNLVKLESLSVCSNKLIDLPHSLSNLKHLKKVSLSDNQISVFPLMFNGLPHLDALDLSKNKITVIPDGVPDLRVIELNLNQNIITTISDRLAECPRLKTLRLEENCLQLAAITPTLLKESIISNLTLDGNLFDMKSFAEADGYDAYMERYTAVKKKMF